MKASTVKLLYEIAYKLEQIEEKESEHLDDLGEKENKEDEYSNLQDELDQLNVIIDGLRDLLKK